MTDLEECAGRVIQLVGKMMCDDLPTKDTLLAVLIELRSLEIAEKQRCAALVEAAGDTKLAKVILGGCSPERKAER